jgi:predicted HTH transcriptional regulator
MTTLVSWLMSLTRSPWISKTLRNLDLVLLTRKNEIIDYCSSEDYRHRYSTRKEELSYEDQLKQIVKSGETETCEMKEYIDLSNTQDSKALELDIAVCALSNHLGGWLFIGVRDDTEVIALASNLRACYKRRIEDAIDVYITTIKTRLRENLRSNGCFVVEVRQLFSQFVVVIRVERSESVNLLLNQEIAYIRKNNTSVKMSPALIEERLQTKKFGMSFGN